MKNPYLKPKVKKESTVEQYLVQQVELAGGEARKVAFIGRQGAPDRVVILPGVIAWVELKSATGTLRYAQEREHIRLREMGQEVFVLRTKEEVDIYLREWVYTSSEWKTGQR